MSGERSTEELIERLARGLAPVRPIAPLRRQLLVVGAVWAATAAGAALVLGLDPRGALGRGGAWTAFAAILALAGAGGVVLGLAAPVPGREPLARAARAVLAAALLAVVGFALARAGGAGSALPLAPHALCAERSLLLAIPAALAAFAFARRGAPWRFFTTALGVALGAAFLGGLLVHASCPSPDAWHWLLAHALAPLAGGGLLGLAGARVLAARARRAA